MQVVFYQNHMFVANALQIYSTVCEEVYVVAFFKVMRQQIIGKWKIQLHICG